MWNCVYSKHSCMRLQQRAIGGSVLESLHIYGEVVRSRRGVESIMLTSRALADIRNELGAAAYKQCERKRRAYLVISTNGEVITVARGRKRFRVNWA